jgi:hypothetical protein
MSPTFLPSLKMKNESYSLSADVSIRPVLPENF